MPINKFKRHSVKDEKILKEYIRLHTLEENNNFMSKANFVLTKKSVAYFYIYSMIFSGLTLPNMIYQMLDNYLLYNIFYVLTSMFIADFISGIIHIYLDHSKIRFDGSLIDFYRLGFQVHHLYPDFQWIMDPLYQPHYEAVTLFPIVCFCSTINNLVFQSLLLYLILYFCLLFQVGHYWAHSIIHRKNVPWFVRKLQYLGIVIHPSIHQKHHQTFDTNYCILNGWANFIFNYLETHTNILKNYVILLDKVF